MIILFQISEAVRVARFNTHKPLVVTFGGA